MERTCNRPTATAIQNDPLDVSDLKLQEISFDNSFSLIRIGSSDEFETPWATLLWVWDCPALKILVTRLQLVHLQAHQKRGDVYEFSDDQNAGDSGIASIITVTSSLNNMSLIPVQNQHQMARTTYCMSCLLVRQIVTLAQNMRNLWKLLNVWKESLNHKSAVHLPTYPRSLTMKQFDQ